MGSRRRARECALQVLYALDCSPCTPDQAIEQHFKFFLGEKPMNSDEMEAYAEALVRGVCLNKLEIDQRIQASSHHWKLARMSIVDRNLLRLATYEILRVEDVPRKVAINEAIEISKKFGSEDSPSFINGILDRIAQDVGRVPGREGTRG